MAWYHKEISGSVLQAEAKALLLAINQAKKKNWSNLLLLKDDLILAETIHEKIHPPWEIASILNRLILKMQ